MKGGLHCKTELAYFLENFNFRCLPRWILCRLICLLLPTFTAVCSFQFHFRLLILLLWSSLLFVRLLAVVLYSASSRRIALPSPSVRCSTLRLSSSYAFFSFLLIFPVGHGLLSKTARKKKVKEIGGTEESAAGRRASAKHEPLCSMFCVLCGLCFHCRMLRLSASSDYVTISLFCALLRSLKWFPFVFIN